MTLQTTQARSVYLPRLGATLRFASMAQPPALVSPDDAATDEHERQLAELVQFVTATPAGHAMSFTRWHEISAAVGRSLADAGFTDQLRATSAGSDENRQADFDSELVRTQSTLARAVAGVPDVAAYSALLVRNILLNSGGLHTSKFASILGLSGYDETSIVRSLYHDLAHWDELTLSLWSTVTAAAMNENILPSTKTLFEEVFELEVPFSGSLISLSLAQVMQRTRGAAMVVVGGGVTGAAAALAQGSVMVALTLTTSGLGCGLLLISFGVVLPYLEGALERGAARVFGEPKMEDIKPPARQP